ncbi:MAG TPA: divergent polysaccharide deacetylase family protein, partial [Candidatus Cloacimonadota bacterium]|nr:divergent polysaccharide deacetylase family protein [Candidatus Cloacimonadota bacterium]
MDLQKVAILALIILLGLFACKGKPASDEDISPNDGQSEYTPEANEPEAEADSDADLSPLKSYQYTWSEDDDLPPVVIIIDDFGNSAGKLLEDFADLPDEVVFAVLPDLPHTETAAKLAHRKGHEVIIHVPMQAEGNSVSPGKKYIKAGMPESDIKEIMADFIAQIPMAIAANNHMGSAATANRETMNSVLHELKQNG